MGKARPEYARKLVNKIRHRAEDWLSRDKKVGHRIPQEHGHTFGAMARFCILTR